MKSIRLAIALSAVACAAAVPSAQAQLRRTTPTQIGTYPTATNVPAGMCQVWINGLPTNRQPAPTDCATARANAPANSRIIYGGNSGSNTRGTYDPRRDPRSPQYDPRYGQYGGQQYPGERGRGNSDWKAQKEREKAARKAEKERQKAWKKGNNHGDHNGNDDHDGNGRDDGRYGNRGNGQGTCTDANRDGICDYRQRTGTLGSVRFP